MNKSIPNGVKIGDVPSDDNQEAITNRSLPVYTTKEDADDEERSANKHYKTFGG